MKKHFRIFSLLSLITFVQVCLGQTTVFTDNFNRATLSPGGTPSMTYTSTLAGTSTATTNSSTNLRIANGTTSGISYVSGVTSIFSAPYNTILHSNVGGIITWTFNFKYNRTTNPDGIASGSYGTAIVLAGSNSNLTIGTGYAIVYGQSGATDPIRLVRYSNGVGTSTDIISSGINDISNFTNFVSVRVTYLPSSNAWSLYIRDDGTSAWSDPSTGVINQIGSTLTDGTYTASALTAFGFVWSHANAILASNCTDFDNFRVVPPPIVSVSTNSLTFGNVTAGTSSAEQNYTVSGHSLIDNIVITSSQPYLEISQTSGSGFSTGPITLTQTGGVVGSTTIYARWSPLAINNTTQYAFINNTTTSGTTQILDCSGKGIGPNLYGNVYNDLDGSAGSNKVDGTGIGSPGGTQLYATLVQGGVAVLSTAVDPTGVYYFMNQALGNYTILISTTNYATGFVNPVPSLPSGWTFNGEINNDSGNTLTGNTAPTDGVLSINVTTYDSNINFGIIQTVSPPTVKPGGPDNVCQSASPAAITLSSASVGGSATTGAWSITSPSGSGTLSSTAQTATPSTVTYTPAANFTGIVTLTLTSNGSPVATGTRTINVNPLPSSSISATNDACLGSTIVYSVQAGLSSYTWAVTPGGTINAGGGISDNTVTVTWNTTVTQMVSVTYTNSYGCSASSTRTVPIKALPTCLITGSDGPIAPSSTGNIYTAPGGKSYLWSVTGNASIIGSSTSQTVSLTAGSSCGVSFSLTLEVTDLPSAVVSCSSFCNKVVMVSAIPTITGTTPGSVCGTGTVNLGATGSIGIINWYDALTGGTLVGTGTSFTTPVISATTTYYAEAANSGCTSASRTAVVATVNPLPIVSAPASVNVGSTITLSPTTGGTWTSSNNLVATVTNAGVVTGVSAGTATFTFTNTLTGCSATTSLVTVNNSNCSFLSNMGFETSPSVSTYIQTAEANVPPWHTTASDHKIEIW